MSKHGICYHGIYYGMYYLLCKQFQFVDSMLFGKVRRAVFWALLKYFWGKDGSPVR